MVEFSLPEEAAPWIVARSEKEGQIVTLRQLGDWRGKGLIPSPKRPGLGRGRGSQTLYPSGTLRQVMACSNLFKQKLKAKDVGWELWVQGFSVHEKYWNPYFQIAGTMLINLKQELLGDDDGHLSFSDALEGELKNVIGHAKLPTWVNRMRQRIGVEASAGFLGFVFNVATENYPIQQISAEDLSMVSRAFGFQSAAKKKKVAPLSFVENFQSAVLENFGIVSANIQDLWSPTVLASHSEEVLRDATRELYILNTLAASMGGSSRQQHPYFIQIQQIMKVKTHTQFAVLVLVWSVLREVPELREAMSKIKAQFLQPY